LYVPDIEPGLALKTLARFADAIAVTAPDSRAYFTGRSAVTVTGYPLRSGLAAWEPEKARQVLGLSADLPTLLVMGGSKGARTINRSLLAALPELLQEMQVVHIGGQVEWPEIEAARADLAAGPAAELAARYHAYPYLHEEIGAAFTVADLVLTRAGASALGELPLFGLPAVLVPYPYAWRYQRVNADYLARHSAAVVVENADLPSQILPTVSALMRDARRRDQMRQAMRSLFQPQSAEAIAGLVHQLAQEGLHG
jgi:UDP-N-acetylglucosamine:LPS N-acetylglucosamine transferase